MGISGSLSLLFVLSNSILGCKNDMLSALLAKSRPLTSLGRPPLRNGNTQA